MKHIKDLLMRGANVKHKSKDGALPIDRIYKFHEKKAEIKTLLEQKWSFKGDFL